MGSSVLVFTQSIWCIEFIDDDYMIVADSSWEFLAPCSYEIELWIPVPGHSFVLKSP